MKQSSASVPALAETFYLSEGERQLLVSADVGEGVFFAGQNHVALRVVASPEEHEVITTDPREVEAKLKRKKLETQPRGTNESQASSLLKQYKQSRTNQTTPEIVREEQQKEGFEVNTTKEPAQENNKGGAYSIEDYQEPA